MPLPPWTRRREADAPTVAEPAAEPAAQARPFRSCLAVPPAYVAPPTGILPVGEQPSRQWIADRLDPLSYLLARPQPTRGGFVFAADERFYDRCDEGDLQAAVDLLLAHLGVPRSAVGHVAFDPVVDYGGRVTHYPTTSYLQFSPHHTYSPHELGALIAHACAHVLAHRVRLPAMGDWEDELNTDLVAVLGGLGLLLANVEPSVTFLSHENATYAYSYVNQTLGLERRREPVSLLRFGPPAELTWVRCPFCAHAMKIRGAAGRPCQVACRGCGTTFPFDGRLCDADRRDDDA